MQTLHHKNIQISFSENASMQQVLDLLQTSFDTGLKTEVITDNNARLRLEVTALNVGALLTKVHKHFDGVSKSRESWVERRFIPIRTLIETTGLSRRTLFRRMARIPHREKRYRNCSSGGQTRRFAAVKEDDLYYIFDDRTVKAVHDVVEACKQHHLMKVQP